MLPDVIKNWNTAEIWEEQGGVITLLGKKLTLGGEPLELTEMELLWKKLGLTPLRVTKAYEEMLDEMTLVKKRNAIAQDFYQRMARAKLANDVDKMLRIQDEINDHNERHPEMKIKLDRDILKRKVDELQYGKSMETIPKSIRGEIKRRREEVYKELEE